MIVHFLINFEENWSSNWTSGRIGDNNGTTPLAMLTTELYTEWLKSGSNTTGWCNWNNYALHD